MRLKFFDYAKAITYAAKIENNHDYSEWNYYRVPIWNLLLEDHILFHSRRLSPNIRQWNDLLCE